MVSEDRCRRNSGQDGNTLASDKPSCMRLRGRAKHIRRQKATIIHLSWTTKNNFLAVPGRLTTSSLHRQIHGVSAIDPLGHDARASGECSTVIVMPL